MLISTTSEPPSEETRFKRWHHKWDLLKQYLVQSRGIRNLVGRSGGGEFGGRGTWNFWQNWGFQFWNVGLWNLLGGFGGFGFSQRKYIGWYLRIYWCLWFFLDSIVKYPLISFKRSRTCLDERWAGDVQFDYAALSCRTPDIICLTVGRRTPGSLRLTRGTF